MTHPCTFRPAARSGHEHANRHAGLVVGAGLVTLLLVAMVVSLFWSPYPPNDMDVANKLQRPSRQHWLGTDSLGRDITSQLLAGSQNSLAVGLAAVGLGLGVGVALGCLAAARRGWVDALIMRSSEFAFAFPALVTAVMLAAVRGPGLLTAALAIGLFNIPVFARLSRGAAQAVWAREFVQAAQLAGRGRWGITRDHVLPNITHLIIVQASVQFALAILGEAALSYLGLGAQPPQPSWGRMLNEAQEHMFQAPFLAVAPGLAIALTVLGLNLLGDGLRDVLDPRLPRSR